MRGSEHKTDSSRGLSPSILRVRYRVREGVEEAFDHWLREISWYEMNACGNTGVSIEHKLGRNGLECHVISFYRNEHGLNRWLHSEQRQSCLSRLPKITCEQPKLEHIDPDTAAYTEIMQTRPAWTSHSLASLITKLALVPLVMALQSWLQPWFEQVPRFEPLLTASLVVALVLLAHFAIFRLARHLINWGIRWRWYYRNPTEAAKVCRST